METTPVLNGRSRTRWGRSRFGGGGATLGAVSLGLGVVFSSGLGWLAWIAQPAQPRPLLLFIVVAVTTLPITTVGVWALLVDRSTVTGAIDDPDETVENRWYETAATASFHALLATLGLGLALFSLLPIDVAPAAVIGGYLGLGIAVFAVRYLVAKRKDS